MRCTSVSIKARRLVLGMLRPKSAETWRKTTFPFFQRPPRRNWAAAFRSSPRRSSFATAFCGLAIRESRLRRATCVSQGVGTPPSQFGPSPAAPPGWFSSARRYSSAAFSKAKASAARSAARVANSQAGGPAARIMVMPGQSIRADGRRWFPAPAPDSSGAGDVLPPKRGLIRRRAGGHGRARSGLSPFGGRPISYKSLAQQPLKHLLPIAHDARRLTRLRSAPAGAPPPQSR